MAASSCLRSSESDTFEGQESLLVLEPERAVRAQPVRPNHAVAGHDDPVAVACAEASCGTLGTWIPGEACEIAVGDDLSVRDAAQRIEDRQLEGRPTVEVELEVVEGHALSLEVRLKPVDQLLRSRHRAVVLRQPFSG